MPTDADLLRAARRDADAFRAFYRRHAPKLHAWLAGQVGDVAAADLTAETFAQAWLSLRRFRDERDGSAEPWLYGIARHLVVSYRRRGQAERRARERLGMLVDAGPAQPTPEEEVAASFGNGRLEVALAGLPAADREVVDLRIVQELPYASVAERLGCSEAAARMRLMRAVRLLTATLERRESP